MRPDPRDHAAADFASSLTPNTGWIRIGSAPIVPSHICSIASIVAIHVHCLRNPVHVRFPVERTILCYCGSDATSRTGGVWDRRNGGTSRLLCSPERLYCGRFFRSQQRRL